MLSNDVKATEHAFVNITDRILATLVHMAMLKNKNKSEFERQISIAQHAVDLLREIGVNVEGTRAEDVERVGG